MAVFKAWTPESLALWEQWLAGRPQVIKDVAAAYPPNRLYRHTPTGQRVFILAYSEDRTVRMAVTGTYNFLSMERQVFGVPVDELVECELPAPGEPLGAVLTPAEVEVAMVGTNSPSECFAAIDKAARKKLLAGG